MRRITDQQRAKSLLDFIAQKESGGSYNRVYGRNKYWNMSSMTLNQVMAKQRRYVNSGSKSSAAGRYQFLRGTLRSLKAQMHLSGNERFTPQLQDRLGLALLRRRGYEKFQSGKMSASQFANNVAKEWASMPVVSGRKRGRSYYAGDGLNHSLVNVNPFLRSVRSSLVAGKGSSASDPLAMPDDGGFGGGYQAPGFGGNRLQQAQSFFTDMQGATLPDTAFLMGTPQAQDDGMNAYNYQQSQLAYMPAENGQGVAQDNLNASLGMGMNGVDVNVQPVQDVQRMQVSSAINPDVLYQGSS